jgi:hypothetical protein
MDETQFEKNAVILRRQWIEELEGSIKEIEGLIEEEFYEGIWGFLFNKLLGHLYSLFLSKDIKKKILKQFDLLLEAGREYNSNSEEVLQKYFAEYIANDPGYARCKKTHSKSAELRDRIKKSFGLMVKNSNDLLNSCGDCYDDLLFNAYKTKTEAWRATFDLIKEAEETMEFTIKHKMLKITSLIRNPTIKILRREIEISRTYYSKKLNELFSD